MIRGDNHLILDNLRDDYPKLFQWVHEHGTPVSPWGILTYELRDVSLTLLDPFDSYPFGVGGQQENLTIPAVEALQLIAGVRNHSLMNRIGMRSDCTGERLRYQLLDIATVLEVERPTRQAIGTIWDPAYDRIGDEDLPYSVSYQFLYREDQLELHVHMRSCDVAYDTFNFTWARCQLLLTMCNVLNVKPGPYHLHVSSFHLYGRDVGLDDTMHLTTVLTRPNDLQTGLGETATSWREVADRARFILDVGAGRITEGVNANAFTPNEKWYLEQIRPYWMPGG